jgi:hypothetical protein
MLGVNGNAHSSLAPAPDPWATYRPLPKEEPAPNVDAQTAASALDAKHKEIVAATAYR